MWKEGGGLTKKLLLDAYLCWFMFQKPAARHIHIVHPGDGGVCVGQHRLLYHRDPDRNHDSICCGRGELHGLI